MKTTDLSCGDLILVNGRPTRVYGVMERTGRVYDTMTNDTSIKRCEPIPLTKEILEKNGFTQYGSDELFFECKVPVLTPEPCTVLVTLQNKDPEYDDYSASIKIFAGPDGSFSGRNDDVVYVHQLQHALRLCGIEKEIVL